MCIYISGNATINTLSEFIGKHCKGRQRENRMKTNGGGVSVETGFWPTYIAYTHCSKNKTLYIIWLSKHVTCICAQWIIIKEVKALIFKKLKILQNLLFDKVRCGYAASMQVNYKQKYQQKQQKLESYKNNSAIMARNSIYD